MIGIGCDLVEIDRIKQAWQGYGDELVAKVLTSAEKEIFLRKNQSMEFLAGRFAVKEAAAKALGLGFTKRINMRHFICLEGKNREPLLTIDSFALSTYNNYCRNAATVIQSIHAYASISHTRGIAQGFVILTEN